ncbi:YjeF N-terminal domain-containing protein [Bisporella sp. PMI_857]|nr:YjeF N-terminal domain-containing protein [Bisporella sp. PMI_857]KAH8600449.1 YjeF N-terminal domain-containing protein [Bisporella sp. PMI_857]
MSNQFIGLTMLVTLHSPVGAQLRGIVSSLEPGKSLTLRDVTAPASGRYFPQYTIQATEIAELVEAQNENVHIKGVPPAPIPAPQPKRFEDPAILSVGRRPTPGSRNLSNPSQWNSTSMERVDSSRTVTSRDDRVLKDITPVASLAEPLEDLHIAEVEAASVPETVILSELEADAEAEISAPPPLETKSAGKRSRRRKVPSISHEAESIPGKVGRREAARHTIRSQGPNQKTPQADDLLADPTVTLAKAKQNESKRNQQSTGRSKGWRQTPLLEPNPSFQPFATLKKSRKKGRNGQADENGWGTEDATDVQEMGDFDFAGSLAKFDKHSVFTQIQAEDGTADEDRLVSHNRLARPRPGTAGGKNLHYTENVLDSPTTTPRIQPDDWKSDADDSMLEERISQRDTGSGRASRRADSKLATKRNPSRKGSATANAAPAAPARTLSAPAAASRSAFFLVPSNQRCEPISALQMLNLETIADNDLGLTEDMMAENAGRGIAEVALSAVSGGARGLTQGKSSIIPTVVIFAGNNKSGLRSVAAARHLRNHGLNVVVCVLGLERESEFLAGLRRQLKVFRSFGGKLVNKAELLEYVTSLNAPIELIIDGLLGLTISFEELRTGDQATAYELIEFANRSKAAVLAIDVPTGIDPTTGKVNIIDGRQLYLHAKYVVCMGAPKKGLLEAMALGEGAVHGNGIGSGNEWQLFVADVGLGAAVWKKSGTRLRHGVEFDGSWVLGMRFQGNAE